MFVDYYKILDVNPDATNKEIKDAYRIQAIKWHPDKNPNNDTTLMMQLINESYLILSDREARERYDNEYFKYKFYEANAKHSANSSSAYTDEDYVIEDDILYKWMQNAKKQAVDLAKQAIKDFKDVGSDAIKGAVKDGGTQLLFQILITIFAIILFSIIGKCK